jgi:alpha-tubulin suppressor-like RCC1 family protein
VSAGGLHTCAIDSNSERWCWGDNQREALGSGGTVTTNQPSPVQMPASPGPPAWGTIVAGDQTTCGISGGANAGELWCFGDNSNGELGVGTPPTPSSVPVEVDPSAVDWRRVATDVLDGTTCGIRGSSSGGALYCWGQNTTYQLGLGDTTQRTVPTQIGTGLWLEVDTGAGSTCAISDELEIFCWGLNDSLQSSDDADVYEVPEPPSNPTIPGMQFKLLAVGWSHVCAVRTDDQIYCWGGGTYGQHGDGNQAHLTPTPVVLAD